MSSYIDPELLEFAEKVEEKVRCLCVNTKTYGRELLAEFQVTPPQFDLLISVYFEDNVEQIDVPKKLHLAKSTISAMLDRLEGRGLITRKKTERDKRISVIKLTLNGQSLIEQVIERRVSLMARLLNTLTEKERESFYGMLVRLEGSLESAKG